MALTSSYLVTTKNLTGIINSITSAKAPERFTNKFLEDLGFRSSNDRLYVGLFKALGFLEEDNKPTQRYFELLDQTQTGKIIAEGVEEAYSDLFNLKKDAQNLSLEDIKNKLKTLTQGQKSDVIINNMANTFKALCSIADWKKTDQKLQNSPVLTPKNSEPIHSELPDTSLAGRSEMNLHYNIQIHLPETSNTAVYDAIFQSLKKHIF